MPSGRSCTSTTLPLSSSASRYSGWTARAFDELFEDDALLALYEAPEATVDDPLESLNRGIFWFNDQIFDRLLLRPIAWLYSTVMPDVAKPPIRNAFKNLNAPVVFANDLLQGEIEAAGVTLGRFALNSTVGLLGLFDGFGFRTLALESDPFSSPVRMICARSTTTCGMPASRAT